MTYSEVISDFESNMLVAQGFTKSSKSVKEIAPANGTANILQDGDTFILPDSGDVPVYEKTFGGNKAYGIVVTKDGKPFLLYPSMMSKWAIPYDASTKQRALDAEGSNLPRVEAKGTACEAYKKAINLADFLESNKGKTVKVISHQVVYTCINPVNDPQYRTVWLYSLDFVG